PVLTPRCPLLYPVTATTQDYTLSLHDALPISEMSAKARRLRQYARSESDWGCVRYPLLPPEVGYFLAVENYDVAIIGGGIGCGRDRKRTRLNSSHVAISYAVFGLKKPQG